jgi:hypothetical protein
VRLIPGPTGYIGVSSKGKVVVKPKLTARISPKEAKFLDNLASWTLHSGTAGKDDVFIFH